MKQSSSYSQFNPGQNCVLTRDLGPINAINDIPEWNVTLFGELVYVYVTYVRVVWVEGPADMENGPEAL